MSESKLSKQILLEISRFSNGKVKLFRNNVGNGVSGRIYTVAGEAGVRVNEHPGRITLCPGDFIVKNGRRVQYGLCPGSSDYIGLVTVVVTPAMVGQEIAVFTGLEIKDKTGRVRPEQENFIQVVRAAGGYAGIVRSVDEAVGICNPLNL